MLLPELDGPSSRGPAPGPQPGSCSCPPNSCLGDPSAVGSEHLNGGETEQQEPQAKCRASASATWPGSGCSGRASCPWCGPRCPGRERAQNTDAGAPPAKGLSPRDPRILSRGAGDPGSARRGYVAKTKGHPGCHLPGLSSRQCRRGCGGREQPGPGVAVGVGQRLEPGDAFRAREAPGSLAEAWGTGTGV